MRERQALLTDKILAGFTVASPYRMFETGNFFRNYKKDTFYRFDLLEKASCERLQLETASNVISDVESQTDKKHNRGDTIYDTFHRAFQKQR